MVEMIHLRIVQGADVGREISVPESGALVGRSSACDLVVRDGKLSRHHCRFLYRADKLAVSDLESSNGTLVNGQPIREVSLKAGDMIAVGDTVIEVIHASLRPPLVFKRDEPEAGAAAPPAPEGRRELPFWIRGPAWLILVAWFLFLAYSLIPREGVPRGVSPAADGRSTGNEAADGRTTRIQTPSTKAGGTHPSDSVTKPATPEELAGRLRALTKAVALSLVKEDYDQAQALIRAEASLPSALPMRSRIEALASSVTAVKGASQSLEDEVMKQAGKEMTIGYKNRRIRVIPRAVVNGKLAFALPDSPGAPHLSLAVTNLAASDRLALLGTPDTPGKRILRCALHLQAGNLAEARRTDAGCQPVDEAFAEIAAK